MMSKQDLTCRSYTCQRIWFRQSKSKANVDQQLILRSACTLQVEVRVAQVSGLTGEVADDQDADVVRNLKICASHYLRPGSALVITAAP